jgi:RNA polymerase sigma-70 factor (ECF subfamily)
LVLTGRRARAEPDGAILDASREQPERFAELFDAYYREIYQYAASRLSVGLADDVAAETFLVAFRGRDRFVGSEVHVRAWLYGIATNVIRRHWRDEERKYRALSKADALERSRTDEDHEDRVLARVVAHGVQRDLAAALRTLNPGDRDVLLLVALAEFSYAEVAVALGIAEGTVASRLSRARKVVRAALGGENPSQERRDG